MKYLTWMFAGIVVLAGLALPSEAQEKSSWMTADSLHEILHKPHLPWLRPRPSLPLPTSPAMPISPDTPKTPATPGSTDPSAPTTPPSDAPDFSAAGEFKGSTGRSSSVVSGTGLGGGVTGDPFVTTILTPLIIPGLLTSTGTQSAIPIDRVSFEYGYYNRIAVQGVGSSAPVLVRTTVTVPSVSPGGRPTTTTDSKIRQSSAPVDGFNLHTFNLGVEKTCFDGLASVYVSVPFLCATENITGQPISGIGDVNLGFKTILYQGRATGNTLTGGFTVSLPTAHAASSTSYMQDDNGDGNELLPASRISTNPTFLQPWLASLLIFDQLFVHQYLSVVVPTDSRVATFINYDFTLGYQIYRSESSRLLSSLTPTVSIHTLLPVNHRGVVAGQGIVTEVPFDNGALPVPPAPSGFLFSDQVFASTGFQVGLVERWMFSANVVVPLAAPRGYQIGATFGLNYYY